MEMMELTSLLWTIFALFVVSLVAFSNRLLLGRNMWKKLPPGSLGWPLIGETLSFYRSLDSSKPYIFHNTRRKRFGDTFMTKYLSVNAIVISTADLAKEVLLSKSFTSGYFESTRQMLGTDSLILLDGERHTRARKIIQPFMMPERLKNLIHVIEEATIETLEQWDGHVMDATLLHRKYAFGVVCKVLFGFIPPGLMEVMEENYPYIKKGLLTAPIDLPGTPYRKSLQARRKVDKCMQQVIDERRKHLEMLGVENATGSTDLLTYMMSAHTLYEEVEMSDKEMKDMLITMMIAGVDTTSGNMSFAMMWLGENPETLRQVRDEQMAIRQRIGPGVPLSWKDLKEMDVTMMVSQTTFLPL